MQTQPHLYRIWVAENINTNKVFIFDSKNKGSLLAWNKDKDLYYTLGSVDYAIEEDFDYIKTQLAYIINNYKNNPDCPIDQHTSGEYIRFFALGYEHLAKLRGNYK